MVGINFFHIIVYKFSYKQKSCPVILLLIDKCIKINLYYTILYLSLAIYLLIKVNKKFPLNAKEIA